MKRHWWMHWLLVAGLLGLVGCAPSSGAGPDRTVRSQTLQAEVLYSNAYCGEAAQRPGVFWIGSAAGLTRLFAGFNRQGMPSAPPTVDFAQQGVLFMAMGQQPTAGYALDFSRGSIRHQGDTLEVTLTWQEPPPGYLLAQVITTPCLLLRAPAVDFSTIRVVDQTGQVRLTGRR